jgi:altronate hydrolase
MRTDMSAPLHLTIRLNPNDNVAIARADILPGTAVPNEGITARMHIPAGHKIATRAVKLGEPLKRYDQIIGFASKPIEPGEHVHTHNVEMKDFARDYAFCQNRRDTQAVAEPMTFQGYRRADGRGATRNYVGIVSSVNCSATASKYVADAFRMNPQWLADYPNVDGVVAITHTMGCGMADSGLGYEVLQRTLGGYVKHANFGAVVMIGLGCEVMQLGSLMQGQALKAGKHLGAMTIQESGGTKKTVERAIAQVREMLPDVNRTQRQPLPVSHIMVGLQCGGSDGYSGITANPALGAAMDLLVRHGGTGILSETPEIYGAEHLLTRRAVDRAVGEKLVARIKWWEEHTKHLGAEMNNNPSPGNKAGGITTILEKSLGAATKGGTTNLVGVFEYAEPIGTKGFVYMDSPGYDPVSATGQIASGANMVCFTTGRGSAFGSKPAPCIKLATNSMLYRRQTDDMDINCGEIITGGETVQQCGERIFKLIVETASGQKTKSEDMGYGDNEFVPWQIGATM